MQSGRGPPAEVSAGVAEGAGDLLVPLLLWTASWAVLFYLLSFLQPWWLGHLRLSSKAHENDRYWCARSVIGIIHALLVSMVSVPAAVLLLHAPEYVQFASSDHVGTCQVDPMQTHLLEWDLVARAVALAGLAFTTFTIADVFICAVHGLATVDYFVHHGVFIAAGLIIRMNCMLPLNASVLMAMEVSTPFLNYMMLVRHRGGAYKLQVVASGIFFVLTFLVMRIGLNGYGTVLLWTAMARGTAFPHKVPTWQGWLLAVAVAAGAAVQFFWLPGILGSFGSKLRLLMRGEGCSAEAEEAHTSSDSCSAHGSAADRLLPSAS